jgi:SAM-dependent methyltransferase
MIEALGIACVKNEADVIEPFVRHNLGLMDALVVLDNDSVDGTREILVQLRQEGLPIVLFDDPIVGHFQAEKVTTVYRQVVPRFRPRFVFLLDADEFIIAPSREALYTQLEALRPGSQAQYYWRTYVPAPTNSAPSITDPLRNITHHKVSEDPWAKSIIATKPSIDTKLKIQQGNHDVKLGRRSLATVRLQDVVLAHFPVRSIDQTTSKALVGWITNMERNRHRRRSGAGFQKKLLYERIVHGPGLTAEDVTQEALKYAQSASSQSSWPQDVVDEAVSPRYSQLTAQSMATSTPLQKVARCVDKILNPDSTLEGVGTATGFLQGPETNTWRDSIFSSKAARKLRDDRRFREARVDLAPFRHLAERDRPESVLDIGCGSGAYLRYFASEGAQLIRGVDRIEQPRFLHSDEYVQADLETPLRLAETFDLVICSEVIQHLAPASESVLVDNVVRHAKKRIVFSSTQPGRPGAAQLNCHPILHWLDLFASAGWYPDLFDSLSLRSLSTYPWLRSGLVVFTQDDFGATEARARLAEIEKLEVRWSGRQPDVVTHPFSDLADALKKGKGRWVSVRIPQI